MQPYKVDFEDTEWQTPARGARAKTYRLGDQQCRILEFSEDFVEPGWCEKGHVGLMLEGVLEVDFDGRISVFKKGDGIFIPPGITSRHKARALTPLTRLFLVESVEN